MKKKAEPESRVISEKRLIHETHRVAARLLVSAVGRPSICPGVLSQLRDFVVTVLRDHHEMEASLLWPRIMAIGPEAEYAVAELTPEHARLLTTLERLSGIDLMDRGKTGRSSTQGDFRHELNEVALEVHDSLDAYLKRQETILFPALQSDITLSQWDTFFDRLTTSLPGKWMGGYRGMVM
jgi:hypothetical protein